MTTYSVRIVDIRTRKQLGSSPPLASAHAAGSMAADAYTVLVGRDGHKPADLDLIGHAVEDGETRPFTPTEEAAMVAGLDQYMTNLYAAKS